MFCTHCGKEEKLNFPIGISEMTKAMDVFENLHKDCLPEWVEPKCDFSVGGIQDRADWWWIHGERGLSSETMWRIFLDKTQVFAYHPIDPDDFKRCYKLLEVIPEWKDRLKELKPLSAAWSNLVDNWEELTRMFEKNVQEEWKNYKEIGMYELMQKCINT